VLHFAGNVEIVKDNLFDLPAAFRLIQQSGNVDWREMFRVYNCGHRMELYLPEQHADEAIAIAASFQVQAKVIGHVRDAEAATVTIRSAQGEFHYTR
jgi:phosphoribosylformylglycinamidine cyclo-ligase